jgi:hypothetical protein
MIEIVFGVYFFDNLESLGKPTAGIHFITQSVDHVVEKLFA